MRANRVHLGPDQPKLMLVVARLLNSPRVRGVRFRDWDVVLGSLSRHLLEVGTRFDGRYFWHRAESPYVSLVAEFFLRRSNRTTVERHLPRFFQKYDRVELLARASSDEVVEEARWAGMRTRLAALPAVAAQFMNRPVWTALELRELPYIGDYAAKAIALYAFNEPTFPIDNNVRRVFTRYLGLKTELELVGAVEATRELILRLGGPRAVREAHLGALALGWEACRVRPKCSKCPLSGDCLESRSAVTVQPAS